MSNLTLRQLETIREVARCGTMVKAAETLCVTPAALTSRVKLLEEDLGVELFDRLDGRLRLTESGKEVVAAAARIESVINELLENLQGKNGMLGGRIRISTVSTAKYFAPRLIAAFMKLHPKIDLRLSIGDRKDVITSLRDYETDIALMSLPPEDFGVASEPIGPHPHVIIALPDHPLARKARVTTDELATENFIVREQGSGTRSMFDHLFSGVSIKSDRVRIEIASNETVKQAVMAGLGLSLISAHTIEAELATGKLIVLKVEGLPIVREWHAIHRSDRTLSPAGRAMWNFMVTSGADFLPKPELGKDAKGRKG
jgi:LysR family transcriptional regulator, low CO2-responsive transcriptional regulator